MCKLSRRLIGTDQREALLQEMIDKKSETLTSYLNEIDNLRATTKRAEEDLAESNRKALAEQDKRLDVEAQLDKFQGKDQALKEEICTLQDTINGKDEAIKSLG